MFSKQDGHDIIQGGGLGLGVAFGVMALSGAGLLAAFVSAGGFVISAISQEIESSNTPSPKDHS